MAKARGFDAERAGNLMRLMAVLAHMTERRVGCHMITVNAVWRGGHRAPGGELREAWEKCAGPGSAGVFDVDVEWKKGSAPGGHCLVSAGRRKGIGCRIR